MTNKLRKLTKATKVLENLRYDIMTGNFKSGEKLQMEVLKERYGVGYSPLREALSRLVSNGLVQMEEQCGFFVAPLSLEELHDLYQMRIYIETLSLELSMQNGDDKWEADVVASWHTYAKYLNPKTNTRFDPNEWDVLQRDFMFNLVKACRSPWLLKIRDMLYDQASRYRSVCLNIHYKNKKLLAEFIKENDDLVAAVLARNKKKAIRITEESWKIAVDIIAKAIKNN